MSQRLLLEDEVTSITTVETVQYGDSYTTCYRINGKKICTLQRYDSQKEANEGHKYWSNLTWPIRSPVEIEDQGKRKWKTTVISWRWLDPDDPGDDEEYYEYWAWLDWV